MIGEWVAVALLVLVFVNQRRTVWPIIRQDVALLKDLFLSPKAHKAGAATWRIALTAALPAYVAYLIVTTLTAAITTQ